LRALINPFQWYHVFIPVLPKVLLEILEAPVPLIAGVPSEQLDYVNETQIMNKSKTWVSLEDNFTEIQWAEDEDDVDPLLPDFEGLKDKIGRYFKDFHEGKTERSTIGSITKFNRTTGT
jgi:hypothetical protein